MQQNGRKLKVLSVLAVVGAAIGLAGVLADEKALRLTGYFLSLVCNALLLIELRKMK